MRARVTPVNALVDPTQKGEAAYFPFKHLSDFMEFLHEHRRHIEIITYDDLAWGDEFECEGAYSSEKMRWLDRMRRSEIDRKKIYVLLQHDVDTREERTFTLLREQERLGLRSNVMVFRHRVNRRHLQATGELELTPYKLDIDYLKSLEHQGFVIAYHSNAYEQALFDVDRAQAIFEQDVAWLAKRFDLKYFSAHGGTPGPNGTNNRNVPVPASLRQRLRWVHNGHSPWFTASYSDGGINSPKRDPAKRDLRDFVKAWRPGSRYRVLVHPQYYHQPCKTSPRLAGVPWYEEVQTFYRTTPERSIWEAVALRHDTIGPPSRVRRVLDLGVRIWRRW